MEKINSNSAVTNNSVIESTNPINRWREENGVIYFSVTSDGTTGPEWIERFKNMRVTLGGTEYGWPCVETILQSLVPTSGVTSMIGVLKGVVIPDKYRRINTIRYEAEKRQLFKLSIETLCLIVEKFSGEDIDEMGIKYIVAMHKPFKYRGEEPTLLIADSYTYGHGQINFRETYADDPWDSHGGFAFVVL